MTAQPEVLTVPVREVRPADLIDEYRTVERITFPEGEADVAHCAL